VDLTELAEQPVPLVLTGNSVGVRDGGVLDQPVREVVVSALPDDLPDSIEADVTGLEVGGTLHLSDLTAPEGVRILGDPELVIASVTTPSAVVEEPTEEAEALPEGAEAEREAEAGAAEGGDAES
jgi:large subunit ribosomal protein L25